MAFSMPRFLLHSVAVAIMTYGFNSLDKMSIDEWIRSQYGGHYQYLTIQGLIIAGITMAVGVASDLLPSVKGLVAIKRALFMIAMPLAAVISCVYWALLTLSPDLILQGAEKMIDDPEVASSVEKLALVRIPLPVDLSLHMAPGVALIADFFLFERKFTSKEVAWGPLVAGAYTAFYGWWVEHCSKHNAGNSLIALIGFAWAVLLCVDLYLQWDGLDRPGKSFTIVMLILDTLTIFMVLILLALPFRPWLDAARCLFLFVTHVGLAIAFARWSPTMTCPTATADEEGSCRLANFYILLASWVIPALVIVYAGGLGLMLYRRKRLQAREEATKSQNPTSTSPTSDVDVEKRISGSTNSRESFFPEAKSSLRNSESDLSRSVYTESSASYSNRASSQPDSRQSSIAEPRRSYVPQNRRSDLRITIPGPDPRHRSMVESRRSYLVNNRRSDLRISHPRLLAADPRRSHLPSPQTPSPRRSSQTDFRRSGPGPMDPRWSRQSRLHQSYIHPVADPRHSARSRRIVSRQFDHTQNTQPASPVEFGRAL
ncbi:hypothetical protein VNI00_008202 [Paramarasmius palmivorus]|uniref:Uncharacterized protein n=1 Tax=Paramarasmius palmivorus TaxID=297713 RepID=A0AAW0CX21_9AGAR